MSTATSAKKRKNECASKIRREKNSGLKKKKTSNSDPGTIGKAKNKPKKDKEVAKTNSQSPGTFMQTMSAVAPRWHDLLKVCERSVTEEEEEQKIKITNAQEMAWWWPPDHKMTKPKH